MSSLSNKYNVPAETIKKMICDGVIASTWTRWEEIYDYYKKSYSSSGKKADAVDVTAIEKNISSRQVYKIIHYVEG